MAIRLENGQRINLEKSSGAKLTNFCVGCNWGAVERMQRKEVVVNEGFLGLGRKTEWRDVKTIIDVDLDLSCLMFDSEGEAVDHIYSNLYRFADKGIGLPNGKHDSIDRALHHTGDDTQGDVGGDDGLDNEIITVDLSRVGKEVRQIVFFLNIYNNDDYSGDFSGIPYASIRMYEGTPTRVREVFAQYDVATKTECIGKRALILGKLYKHNSDWKFAAIGDAFEDNIISKTIIRVVQDYSK